MSRQEFESTLQRLKDLPDRFVIHDLTCLASELAPLANYVVDAIADRINQVRQALLGLVVWNDCMSLTLTLLVIPIDLAASLFDGRFLVVHIPLFLDFSICYFRCDWSRLVAMLGLSRHCCTS
jgi:hypothetical protein